MLLYCAFIFRHEKRVTSYCSIDVEALSKRASRGVVRRVLATIWLTNDEVGSRLKIEIDDRVNEEMVIDKLMLSIKVANSPFSSVFLLLRLVSENNRKCREVLQLS